MEPLRGDGVRGLTVAVVRVAVEIIPNDGDFDSWLMPTNGQKGGEWDRINNQYCTQMKGPTINLSHEDLRQIYANRVRRIVVSLDTETVRAECGAGYL